MMAPGTSTIVIVAFAAFLVVLVRRMRRMSLLAQFLVLILLAVCIGFVFLTVVQVPGFPVWLAGLLVVMVFVASPFATRTFMRAIKQEEEQEESDAKAH